MNAFVPAKKISKKLKNAAFNIAKKMRLFMPSILTFLSSGRSLDMINPATANIIDNSHDTPMRMMNEVLSGDTVQSAYPEAA